MTVDRAAIAYLRHELRTPLNHIIGYGEMLLEETDGSSRRIFVAFWRTRENCSAS